LENGSLTFAVQTNAKAELKIHVPVEGEFEDNDGMTIHALTCVDGMVNELEIYTEKTLCR